MTVQLCCHHGHELQISGAPADVELVCSLCGCITTSRRSGDTQRPGSRDATIDSEHGRGEVAAAPPGAAESHVELVDDAAASMFLTLDYSPPAESGLSAGSEPSGSRSNNDTADSEELEPPNLPGYRIVQELGRGGMGVVYRAHDETIGRDVALKTLQRMNPDSLQRFKGEFRSLADIAHPNLASLYELLSDGENWCFSMEILEGVEFLEYVWSGFERVTSKDNDERPAPSKVDTTRLTSERIARLQDAMKQLTIGLSALHAAGILHSDVKPSNVFVTTEGRLVLLDFGLAVSMDQRRRNASLIQGTPRYMSPEQANASPLTEASDWYSVGVMLYEVLTGRLPFRGKTLEILSKKQTQLPVDPAKLRPDNPQHLNNLCVSLLSLNPEQRPCAQEVLRCFGVTDVANEVVSPRQSVKAKHTDLVGRERHLDILQQSFSNVATGDALSVFVHGRSGMGKSVLVRTFLDAIQQRGEAVVLEGRCYEQESVPFKALDSLIDSLAVFLGALQEETVISVMPRDRLALTRVFPVLGGVPEVANANYPSIENAEQQELRQRGMNALRELLQRLAIRQPLVLYVDDLQWGDVDSAGLLADLVRPPDAPRLLLLVSYRSEDAQRSLCLQALDEAYKTGQHLPHREELAVDALTQDESTQLAVALLGRDDSSNLAVAEKIAQESAGWPFFVWELAQHVREDSEIADHSLDLDEVIWSRVTRLPPEPRRLLELVAVSGRPISAVEAYQAIDAVDKGQGYLAQLRTSNFVRTTESEDGGTVVETYHDRVRESVVDHLDPDALKQHCLQLALTIAEVSGIQRADLWDHISRTIDWQESTESYQLEKRRWQRVFDLSSFFDAAGEHEQAFPFALAAAEQARTQNALEVAQQQFYIARKGAAAQSAATRFRVLEGLGGVLMLRGRYEEARTEFDEALSLAQDAITKARIDGKLGALAFKQGDLRTAGDYIEKALVALGERPPSRYPFIVMRVCKEAAVQILHSFFPSRIGKRNVETAAGRTDLFRARLFDVFTMVCWYTRGVELCLWSHLRTMNITERYSPSAEMAKAYSFHSIVMSGLPMPNRGIKYAQRSHDIFKDRGDLWGQGQALSFYTFNYFVVGQFQKAIEVSSRGVELLEQAGDLWEANMARMMNTWSLYHAGDLKSAYEQNKRVLSIGKEVGDYSAMAISLCFWMQIDAKSAPEGEMQVEVDRQREDATSGALAIQGRGLEILFREDDPTHAAEVLQESLDLCKRKGIRNVCVFASATWKVTALRIAAEREPEGPDRQRALKQAHKAARAALKITKKYVTCRAHLLRECGALAVLAGREQRAQQHFEESMKVADSQGARREYAMSMLACGKAGLAFGWRGADEQVARAEAEVASIEEFAR